MKLDYRLRYLLWLLLFGYGLVGFLYIAIANQDGAAAEVSMLGVLLAAFLLLAKWLPWRNMDPDLDAGRAARLVGAMVVVGILLRVAYCVFVPPIQLSDAKDYVETAMRLLNEGRYYFPIAGHELLAYRPPGYPFVLAINIMVFGESWWIPLAINLAALVATCLATYNLALEVVGNRRVGVAAVALLALWPGEVVASGLAMTETLNLCLLTLGLLAYLKALRGQLWWAILAGICTGYGILVRPSLLLYPMVFVVFALFDSERRGKAVRTAFVTSVMSLAVVAPWTIRNYQVFGEFVPVSTNGGTVFYLANNPQGSAGYARTGERDIDALMDDEVNWNRTGFDWGVQWILSDPIGFLMLVPKKQAIVTGRDDHGIYWTLERGHGYTGPWYHVAKWIVNSWWIVIMLLLPVAAWRNRRFLTQSTPAALLIASVLYLLAVHSVFHGQTRHHVPTLAFLAILVMLAVWKPGEERRAGTPA